MESSFSLQSNDHRPSKRPLSIDQNSNMAPRLGGIKQKKLIIHLSTSMWFLLF